MARKANAEEKTPKECRECRRRESEKGRVAKLLQSAIAKMEAKLESDDFKPSVAEFLKLVQLEQELEQDEAKEIKVTWVEPAATPKEEK